MLCVRNSKHLLQGKHDSATTHRRCERVQRAVCVSSVFEEYQKVSGRDIEDSIRREMSGCLEAVFLAIGGFLHNRPRMLLPSILTSCEAAVVGVCVSPAGMCLQ